MPSFRDLLRNLAYVALIVGGILIANPTTYQVGDLDPVPCGSPILFQRADFEDDLVAGDIGEGREWRRENAEGFALECSSQVDQRVARATFAGLLALGLLACSLHVWKAREDE